MFCISGLSGSYYLMWRVFPSTLPLPVPPFSGYILPRDCASTVMIHFQPFSYCLFCLLYDLLSLIPLSTPPTPRPITALPPLHPFPLYQHFMYNTGHFLLFYSFSTSIRYQELEKARIVIFRSWYARITHAFTLGISHHSFLPLSSRPYRRTFPRWLIIRDVILVRSSLSSS